MSVVGNYDVIDVAVQLLEFGVGTWLPFDPGQIKMDTINFSGRMDLIHTCIDPKQIGQCGIVFKPIVCWVNECTSMAAVKALNRFASMIAEAVRCKSWIGHPELDPGPDPASCTENLSFNLPRRWVTIPVSDKRSERFVDFTFNHDAHKARPVPCKAEYVVL